MKKRYILVIVVVLLVLLVRTMVPVDETEYVIVTSFGRPVGEPISEAGLHFKMPWQTRIRLDKRLQVFDPRPSEFLLVARGGEKSEIGQNVLVDYFVTWRILGPRRGANPPDGVDKEEWRNGPLKFLESVNNLVAAEGRLLEVVHAQLSQQLGQKDMSALVSTQEGKTKLAEIESAVTDECRQIALRDFGIEIVDVRIKRINLPGQNKASVFERMRAERERKATEYRAEGQREAMRIRAQADKEATMLTAEAYRKAEEIKGKADAEAIRIYAAAHSKDPEFYELVRTLEAYKKFLDEKTTLVLSSNSELLRLLTHGRRLKTGTKEKGSGDGGK